MDPATQTAVQPADGGLNLSNLLGGLFSAGGVGVSAFNQQQAYNGLQDALKAIGPTSLNSYTLAGPGGMSSGYNQNGGASIGLGSLNPAFGNFSGAAGQGSGAYSPQLLQGLTGNAAGTLGQATGALGSAYGNYGQGMSAANAQLGNLGNFNTSYGNLLNAFRAQSAPGIQQQAYGLQNTLFGNGVADSTGATSGSLAAANFGRGVGQADANNQLNAFQGALSQQNSAASNYGQLTNSANGILSNAFNNFGNTNQLISGLNTAQLNNSLQAVQGAGALNTLGLNNFNAALQTGASQAQARNGSLFPYASLASAFARQPNGLNSLATGLGAAGNSFGGTNGGPGGFLNSILGKAGNQGISSLLGSLFGGGGVTGASAMAAASPALADIGSTVGATAAGDMAGIGADTTAQLGSQLGLDSFGSAGGQAASELQGFSNAGVDAYSATAGADAAGLGATAGGDAAISAGADASASEAAAGLGSTETGLAAGLGAIGLSLGATLYGMSQPAVGLGADYWKGFNNPTGSYGGSGNYTQNFLQLANSINQGQPPPSQILAQYPGVMQAARQMGQLQNQSNLPYGRGGSTTRSTGYK